MEQPGNYPQILEKLNIPREEFLLAQLVHLSQNSRFSSNKPWGYLALPGIKRHGVQFIEEALTHGAVRVFVDTTALSAFEIEQVKIRFSNRTTLWMCGDLASNVAEIAKDFYGDPSAHLTVIGVTGTSGKTTVTHLIEAALSDLNAPCGLIGTIENRCGTYVEPSQLTTPDCVDVQRLLANFLKLGARYVAMEVSSHALSLGRVDGVRFSHSIFTGLSRDHLDFHTDMESYFLEKSKLFTRLTFSNDPAEKCIVLTSNDTEYCQRLLKMLQGKQSLEVLSAESILPEKQAGCLPDYSKFVYKSTTFSAGLMGVFNFENLRVVVLLAERLGVSLSRLAVRLKEMTGVPGRLELIEDGGRSFFIDYAHKPEALEKVLKCLIQMRDARSDQSGRIWTIVGCGGDRDRGKRPLMARVACQLSSVVIFTKDNPRSEDPEDIIHAMEEGVTGLFNNYLKIVDRERAIQYAVTHAKPGDLILIAGKGHEAYPISDRTLLTGLLEPLRICLGSGVSTSGLLQAWELLGLHPRVEIWSEMDQASKTSLKTQNNRFFVSPGIPPHHPFVAGLKSEEISSEIEEGFRILESILADQRPIVVGITGTNGKTTTTQMVEFIAKCLGFESVSCGNIGVSFALTAAKIKLDLNKEKVLSPKRKLISLELSSAQLHYLNFGFLDVSIITNIQPDHLSWHQGFENYRESKLKIRKFTRDSFSCVDTTFIRESPWVFPQLKLLGTHNRDNFQMAAAAVGLLWSRSTSHKDHKEFFERLSRDLQFMSAVNSAASGFRAPEHRIEPCGSFKGAVFYNDSKATNVASVIVALKALEGESLILLLGGRLKGDSFKDLGAILDSSHPETRVIAFGEGGAEIRRQIRESSSVIVEVFKTLEESTHKAAEIAFKMPKVSVLLSPGCSSFDEFKNYEHRGREFKKWVSVLIENQTRN